MIADGDLWTLRHIGRRGRYGPEPARGCDAVLLWEILSPGTRRTDLVTNPRAGGPGNGHRCVSKRVLGVVTGDTRSVMTANTSSEPTDDRLSAAVLSTIRARSGVDGIAAALGIDEAHTVRLLRQWWGDAANLRLAARGIEPVAGGTPFDGVRAQCLMCALWVTDLVAHVRLHGLDLQVYYLAVGLPVDAPLVRFGEAGKGRGDARRDRRLLPLSALHAARTPRTPPRANRGAGKPHGPTPDDVLAWNSRLATYGYKGLDQALEAVFAAGGSMSDLARRLQVRVRDLEDHVRWSAGEPETPGHGSIGRRGGGIQGRLASRLNSRTGDRTAPNSDRS